MRTAAEAEEHLISAKAHSNYTYTLYKEGVLYLYIDNRISYSYRCLTSLVNAGGYQKDDLILTAYTDKGRSVLHDLYRHWY